MATEKDRIEAAGNRKLNQMSQKQDTAESLRHELRGETTQSPATAIKRALEAQRQADESKAVDDRIAAVKAQQDAPKREPTITELIRAALIDKGRSE